MSDHRERACPHCGSLLHIAEKCAARMDAEVDAELRGMGIDPVALAARGRAFAAEAIRERDRVFFSDAMDDLFRAAQEMCCGRRPVEYARAAVEGARMKLLGLAGHMSHQPSYVEIASRAWKAEAALRLLCERRAWDMIAARCSCEQDTAFTCGYHRGDGSGSLVDRLTRWLAFVAVREANGG